MVGLFCEFCLKRQISFGTIDRLTQGSTGKAAIDRVAADGRSVRKSAIGASCGERLLFSPELATPTASEKSVSTI